MNNKSSQDIKINNKPSISDLISKIRSIDQELVSITNEINSINNYVFNTYKNKLVENTNPETQLSGDTTTTTHGQGLKESVKKYSGYTIKIKDLYTGKFYYYNSIRAAGRALNIGKSTIARKVAAGDKRPHDGRYVFYKC